MKKKIFFIAAVLATCLTACSFFIKDDITEYECQVILEGGSGKASVQSPAQVSVSGEEKTVKLIWSSSNYSFLSSQSPFTALLYTSMYNNLYNNF